MPQLPRRSASLRALSTLVPALLASLVAPAVFAGCSPDDDAPPKPDAGPVLGLDGAPVTNPDSSSPSDAAPDGSPDASPSDASPDALPDGSSAAIVQLAVGRDSSCVRRANGTVWCWGKNSAGELGRGTQTPTGTPAPVTGLTDAIDISIGDVHACAVHATGGVSCWGDGASGQLGDGTANTDHFTPNPVIDTATGAPFADAKAVAASFAGYNCILRTSGAVVCWGQDAAGIGAYGDGTNVARNAPGTNVSGITDAIFLSKGDAHACVRLAAGGVRCWGANANAQCTDGVASGIHSTPFTSVHAASATDITTGQSRTCWLLPAGTVQCVGNNGSGQLGNGTKTSPVATPTFATGLSDALQLTSNEFHFCALRTGGKVSCWGINTVSQLGDGTSAERPTPVEVTGLTNAMSVGAGRSHSCALLSNGSVVCWGFNSQGQLGDGTQTTRPNFVSVVGL